MNAQSQASQAAAQAALQRAVSTNKVNAAQQQALSDALKKLKK